MKKILLLSVALLTLLLVSCRAPLFLPDDPADGLLSLTVARNGALPSAEDFLSPDLSEYCRREAIRVSFGCEPDYSATGECEVSLRLSKRGHADLSLPVTCLVIDDTTPPVLSGAVDRFLLTGEGAVLFDGVMATDDCFGEVALSVDASFLDRNTPGVYPVTYLAADASGNEVEVTVNFTVDPYRVTAEMFAEYADPLLSELIPPGSSPEEICHAVYNHLRALLDYTPEGSAGDVTRAAYFALFETHRGDCFSFAAAAQCLLERAGVPSLLIERSPGLRGGTHFWLMVNIAAPGEEDRWYYFDATPLPGDEFAHSGCLLTEAQLSAYNAVNKDFYTYDPTGYPAVASAVVTPTPNLGIR